MNINLNANYIIHIKGIGYFRNLRNPNKFLKHV